MNLFQNLVWVSSLKKTPWGYEGRESFTGAVVLKDHRAGMQGIFDGGFGFSLPGFQFGLVVKGGGRNPSLPFGTPLDRN